MKPDIITPDILIMITGILITVIGGILPERKVEQITRIFILLMGSFLAAIGGFRVSYELANKNEFINNTITRDDTFCYLIHNVSSTGNNVIERYIVNNGQYPLYDIELTITDQYQIDKLFDSIGDEASKQEDKYKSLFNIGDMESGHFREINPIILPDDLNEYWYSAKITAQDNVWIQRSVFKKNNGRWKKAIQVYKGDDLLNLLLESINDKFPRNMDGKIDWK